MDSQDLFSLTYLILSTLFNIILVLTGETGLDAYAAMNILSYYISLAFFYRKLRIGLAQKAINVTYALLFIIIIIYRIVTVS